MSHHSQEALTPFDCKLQLPSFVNTWSAYKKHHLRHQFHGFVASTNLQKPPTPKPSQTPTRGGSTNFLYSDSYPHSKENLLLTVISSLYACFQLCSPQLPFGPHNILSYVHSASTHCSSQQHSLITTLMTLSPLCSIILLSSPCFYSTGSLGFTQSHQPTQHLSSTTLTHITSLCSTHTQSSSTQHTQKMLHTHYYIVNKAFHVNHQHAIHIAWECTLIIALHSVVASKNWLFHPHYTLRMGF